MTALYLLILLSSTLTYQWKMDPLKCTPHIPTWTPRIVIIERKVLAKTSFLVACSVADCLKDGEYMKSTLHCAICLVLPTTWKKLNCPGSTTTWYPYLEDHPRSKLGSPPFINQAIWKGSHVAPGHGMILQVPFPGSSYEASPEFDAQPTNVPISPGNEVVFFRDSQVVQKSLNNNLI